MHLIIQNVCRYAIRNVSLNLHYPFAVKLDKCVWSCNTVKDLSNRLCVSHKTEDLNRDVFNIIVGKFE